MTTTNLTRCRICKCLSARFVGGVCEECDLDLRSLHDRHDNTPTTTNPTTPALDPFDVTKFDAFTATDAEWAAYHEWRKANPEPKETICPFCGKPLSEEEQYWHAACEESERFAGEYPE